MSDASTTRTDANVPALAVFAHASDLALIEDQLQRLRRPVTALLAGGPAEAAQWCAENELPAILMVDISATPHPLAALLELAAQSGPNCRLVALGTHQDVNLYRQLLQAGVFDYLLKPVQFDQLASTLARADADHPLGLGGMARAGRTVAVVGAAGGLGGSTLVAALGQWAARQHQTPTALIDFDRRKSDLALLLGLEADDGLASLLAAPGIDPRLLLRTLQSADPNDAPRRLHLLTQRPAPETPLDPERALELGGALCQLFSLSLWDLPAHRPSGSDEVLAHADVRVILTELSVQGARSTHRLLADIGDESAGQQIVLLASALRQAGKPVLDTAQFQDFVGRAIDLSLPTAGPALSASLLRGPLQTEATGAYAQAIDTLGRRLIGLPAAATAVPDSRLQRWLQRLGRPRPATPARA